MKNILSQNIDLVALSKGAVIAESKISEIVNDFIAMLFDDESDVMSMFDEKDIKLLPDELSALMVSVLKNIDNWDYLEIHLSEAARLILHHGIPKQKLNTMAEILNCSCKKIIGRRWTKAISAAWNEFMFSFIKFIFTELEGNRGQQDADMDIKSKVANQSDTSLLKLAHVQDIRKSEALKERIISFVNDANEIEIEASEVERIDGSAMQLLCALFIYARKNKIEVKWVKPSESVLEAAGLLGMKKVLELD